MQISQKDSEKPKEVEPNPPGGFKGFRSKLEKTWHDNYFATRGISVERALDVSYTGDRPCYLDCIMHYPGWDRAFSIMGECNVTLAQLFGASLIKVGSFSYSAFVRGVVVQMDPTTVASIFGIAEVVDHEYPYPHDAVQPSYAQIATVLSGLSGKHLDWSGTKFDSHDLLEHYKPLQLLICGSLFPTATKDYFNLWYARLLHAIITEKRVCLARCIIEFISFPTQSASKKNFLKCGILITKLCYRAGIQKLDSDETKTAQGKIGEKTLNRREGQTKKRKRDREAGEGTSATVEEEEDMTVPFEPLDTQTTAAQHPPQSQAAGPEITDSVRMLQRLLDGQDGVLRLFGKLNKDLSKLKRKMDIRLEAMSKVMQQIEQDVTKLQEYSKKTSTTSSSQAPCPQRRRLQTPTRLIEEINATNQILLSSEEEDDGPKKDVPEAGDVEVEDEEESDESSEEENDDGSERTLSEDEDAIDIDSDSTT